MACNISASLISAAAIVAGNYDVLTEILLLLPSKTLTRFQSVNKHWQSLIFDEFFTRRHTFHHFRRRRRRQPQPSFLLRATTSQFFYFHPTIKKLVPFYFNNFGNIKILQSCNGLLLLECGDSDIPHSPKDYYVFNPTTMKSRNLLLDVSYRSRKNMLGFCLKFDPSKSNHYMVYCLRSRSKPDRGYCVAVYNSRTHEWKRWWQLSISSSGLYWYKSIYWIQPQATLFCFHPQRGGEYSIYKPPTIQFPGIRKEYVFESNGRMCCAILSLHPDKNNLFVYRMLTNSWSRMCRVKFDPIPVTFLEKNLPNISILGTIKGEFAGKHSALLFHVPGKIMVHQLFKSDTSEVLIDFSREEYYQEGLLLFKSEDAHQFIETLAPV